jgi:hypothetical protein
MAQIHKLRAELTAAGERARGAKRRAAQEITPPPALGEPVGPAEIEGVDEWTSKLEATIAAGRFGPAEIGAARLLGTLAGYVAKDNAVAQALDALVAERSELAGRLSARRAQLQALGARSGGVDPALEALGRKADALLKQRPTPLDDARRAAHDLDRAVVDLAARTRR